jgi:hypothetical protein
VPPALVARERRDALDRGSCDNRQVASPGRTADLRLHCASELIFAPTDPGQDPRHLGTVEPLWTLFDLTPAVALLPTSRSSTRHAVAVIDSMRTLPVSLAINSSGVRRSAPPALTAGRRARASL